MKDVVVCSECEEQLKKNSRLKQVRECINVSNIGNIGKALRRANAIFL